jgi:hypothetical protein
VGFIYNTMIIIWIFNHNKSQSFLLVSTFQLYASVFLLTLIHGHGHEQEIYILKMSKFAFETSLANVIHPVK